MVNSQTETPAIETTENMDNSSNPSEAKLEASISATQLLAIGKRDFICNEFDTACENFSKACEKLTLEFGEKSTKTAEGYCWYGKALWEVSRGKNDFLGEEADNDQVKPTDQDAGKNDSETANDEENGHDKDGLESITEETNSKEEETLSEQDTNDLKENNEKLEQEATSKDEGDQKDRTDEETPKDETKKSDVKADDEADGDDAADGDVDDEAGADDDDADDDEDDIPDAQLAYEMFELARSIYEEATKESASLDKSTEAQKSECYLYLGEITGENGQIEEAIIEYEKALKILKNEDLFPKNFRRTAEVYFNLGCSYDAIYKFENSKECYNLAIGILESRLSDIRKKATNSVAALKTTSDLDFDLETISNNADRKEYKNISDDVLPELKERIIDAENSLIKHEKDKELLKQVFLQKGLGGASSSQPKSQSSSSSTSTSKAVSAPATSINHLIKRKRKSGELVDCSGDGADGHEVGVEDGAVKSPAEKKINVASVEEA